MTQPHKAALEILRREQRPLATDADLSSLLDAIGDARFVLIGEGSHGTHEFYQERARLTRLLIEQKGFTAVAVEADWPDAYRINRFVRGGSSDDDNAAVALGDFQRFPRWMWRNSVVRDFVSWLREYNASRAERQVGFYGLDLYSLHRSMNAVVDYLQQVDPEAAKRARERYSCFEMFGENPQAYGYATEHGAWEPCEQEAMQQLLELQRRAPELTDGQQLSDDELFFAEQNARLARNAEQYYRAMFRGRESSWNIRDTHMVETLEALVEHARGRGQEARVVVWAHNSHLGDARASAMGWQRAEVNLGQLTRERWPDSTFIIGQTTYDGQVLAAHDWDEPGLVMTVRPGLPGSLEALLHDVGERFWLDLRPGSPAAAALVQEQLQRFIGVIYRPATERWSHYVETVPAGQYDALLHIDHTRALRPLDADAGDAQEEVPDLYPSGQ
ncbi:erythromycin esterase family protein [Deinococcus deserti]|uniref:Putative erythromycin esterase n=1 Tax=Deinococcus deserti (strain DSM 17065 / CIP 109153 / LMG 22923 / VCD115) TaxID=546414 RepID=C1D2X7_DEIDV|nr:erythromycin esterase family protein [Deinococcus deserti]ACO47766.1 putative erythromycin esterase [Deinococcus deserti VCD115]